MLQFVENISVDNALLLLVRYVEPQWQLLASNSSANVSQLQTEECLDGWTFDNSEFLATTVSEVFGKYLVLMVNGLKILIFEKAAMVLQEVVVILCVW